MTTPLEILDGITADNSEATYQAFYPRCQAGSFAARETVEHLEALFHESHDPVLKSYCFLLLGAVVDSGQLSKGECQTLADFLEIELNALTDFALKDAQGRYIHFLSHMAYLAESLQKYVEIHVIYDALLSAYLRADVQICGNEDVVMAEVLLGAADIREFLTRLTMQELKGDVRPPVIAEANKKALWMAMYILNRASNKHDEALFAKLVEDLASIVGE